MNQPNIEKFSCKICLEVAQEPVITPCGHLYWFYSLSLQS